MINSEIKKLIVSSGRASQAFTDLLRKLEADHYLIDKGNNKLADSIVSELAAFCIAIYEWQWEKPTNEIIVVFSEITSTNKEGILEEQHILGISSTSKEFLDELKNMKKCSIVPGGYDMLCKFDGMAQEFEGALFNIMKVENPGRLTNYYLDLCDSFFEIITRICNTAGHIQKPLGWEQLLSELKSLMLERQMEILI